MGEPNTASARSDRGVTRITKRRPAAIHTDDAAGDVGGADTGVGGCGFLAANALQAAGEAAIGGVMNSNEASSILQAAHHHELRMRKARARRHAQTRQWVHW